MKNCVICGKEFNEKDFPSPKRKTCGEDCFRILMHNVQTGDKNSYWRGGHSQSRYERIRKLIKLQTCEMCGKTECRLDTHHKDRDKSNNTVDNIMVLCASCHAIVHYIEDNRGLRGWNSGKLQELKDRHRYDVAIG